MRKLLTAVIAAALSASAVPAYAGDDLNGVAGYASTQETAFVDEYGRTLEFHGFVLPYKRAPYFITAAGFSEDDADFLASEGFNLMQVRFTWGAVEPQPWEYDEDYIDLVVRTVEMLTDRGIRVLLQANQGNFGPVTHGQGFPDWATFTNGLPNPNLGFGPNFLLNPALLRAWDNLWANRMTARGEGIQDGHAHALGQIVEPLADNELVVGIDILNEPWLGSRYPGCFPVGRLVPAACKRFDRAVLQPFHERVLGILRPLMPRQLLFYEPVPTFDLGVATHLSDVGGDDPRVAFAFHAYCALDGGGADLPAPKPSSLKDRQCRKEEGRILDHAVEHGEQQRIPVLSSEFGATGFAESTRRLMEQHEQRGLSWTYAAYCCRMRNEVGSGDVILDPSRPPMPDNLDQEKLAYLVRPYPAAVTGTVESSSFDPGSGRYQLSYLTERLGGGTFPAQLETIVSVPRRHYPDGYLVDVVGATVTSDEGAQQLRLRTRPGASRVVVTMRPAN